MADWYDGPAACSISEAFSRAPRVGNRPVDPVWDNHIDVDGNSCVATRVGLFEILTDADRMMHTYTCSGHCFVWNAPNQQRSDGFRLFTYRDYEGWGRVSIIAHNLDTLIDGSGSRMYCGNWRALVKEWGARDLNGTAIVLLDYDRMYVYGEAITQAEVDEMKEETLEWYLSLPEVIPPEPTKEELARKIEYK